MGLESGPPAGHQKMSHILLFLLCFISGYAKYKASSAFARDMRGDVLHNVAETGMMIGLGKRSLDYQNRITDVRSAEFAKKNEYLEDTGVMLGFGKRNQNGRNNLLEDTGMILGLGKRYPSVEDEGILMGFGKRNTGNDIITDLTNWSPYRFINAKRGMLRYKNVQH